MACLNRDPDFGDDVRYPAFEEHEDYPDDGEEYYIDPQFYEDEEEAERCFYEDSEEIKAKLDAQETGAEWGFVDSHGRVCGMTEACVEVHNELRLMRRPTSSLENFAMREDLKQILREAYGSFFREQNLSVRWGDVVQAAQLKAKVMAELMNTHA